MFAQSGSSLIASVISRLAKDMGDLKEGARLCEQEVKSNDEALRAEEKKFFTFKAQTNAKNAKLQADINVALGALAGMKKLLNGGE